MFHPIERTAAPQSGPSITKYESAEEYCLRMGWQDEWESMRERLLKSFGRPRLVANVGHNLYLRGKYD